MPLEHVIRPLLPFIGVLIVTMIIITYVEDFSMFLRRLFPMRTDGFCQAVGHEISRFLRKSQVL